MKNLLRHATLPRLYFAVLGAHQLEMSVRLPLAWAGVAVALVGLVLGERHLRFTAWGIAAIGAVEVGLAPWDSPNHLVLATLVAAGLGLAERAEPEARRRIRSEQARHLLFVVFVLATLQKLTSPLWLDGSYPSMMLHIGAWGHGLLDPFVANTATLRANLQTWEMAIVGSYGPPLRAVAFAAPLTWIVVVGTLIAEAIAAALLVPRRRSTPLALVLVGFVVAIALVRAEFLFLSLVSLLCASLFEREARWAATFSTLTIVLLALWIVLRHIPNL